MKQIIIFIGIFITLFLSCDKDDVSIQKIRNSFIIVGDTSGCLYFDYNPDIVFNSKSDSFDFNYDGIFDMEFVRNDVFIECDWDPCPPGSICDCWPTIFIDYIINLSFITEIAIDLDSTIHEFKINDTISNKNIWTNHNKYPMYHWSPDSYNCSGASERIIGLREIFSPDTLYSWIHIKIENYDFHIKEALIQK